MEHCQYHYHTHQQQQDLRQDPVHDHELATRYDNILPTIMYRSTIMSWIMNCIMSTMNMSRIWIKNMNTCML